MSFLCFIVENSNEIPFINMIQCVLLFMILNPISSTDKITYSTSNKKVVTVSSKGEIKAVKKGKATITVKAGKKSFKISVKVK